jgi:hypothetical protein
MCIIIAFGSEVCMDKMLNMAIYKREWQRDGGEEEEKFQSTNSLESYSVICYKKSVVLFN